jgi:hypothetical protein
LFVILSATSLCHPERSEGSRLFFVVAVLFLWPVTCPL